MALNLCLVFGSADTNVFDMELGIGNSLMDKFTHNRSYFSSRQTQTQDVSTIATAMPKMIFLKMGQPQPLFHLFSSFRTNLEASRIQTWIVRVEGKYADH